MQVKHIPGNVGRIEFGAQSIMFALDDSLPFDLLDTSQRIDSFQLLEELVDNERDDEIVNKNHT